MPYLTMLKLGGALAALLAIGAAGFYVKHVFDVAAEVPQLKQEISDRDARIKQDDTEAATIEALKNKVDAETTAAENAYNSWQNGETQIFAEIRKEGYHAAASTNPVCFPNAGDRSLRNNAFTQLGLAGIGSAQSAVSVPQTAK